MLSRSLIFALFLSLGVMLEAQNQIDGSFPFQSDPDKKYSLIVPSGYDDANPTKVMLGLHPFNTARWSGASWCEYLTEFAELNNLLLVCPDGGADGKIDDPIDNDFTTALLDSVALWYQIQSDKVYAMGFSWGGRTTYTYGLAHTDRLHGFMPIGAAMNGVNIDNVAANADGQPFYFIHGGNDNPGGNFSPYKDLVEANGAIIKAKILPGVGHTIDFADNIAILTDAYRWIDSINCDTSSATTGILFPSVLQEEFCQFSPNPVHRGQGVSLQCITSEDLSLRLYNIQGKQLRQVAVKGQEQLNLATNDLEPGLYFMSLQGAEGKVQNVRLVVR